MTRTRIRLSISRSLILLNTVLIVMTGLTVMFFSFTATKSSIHSVADNLLGEISKSVFTKTQAYLLPAERAARSVSWWKHSNIAYYSEISDTVEPLDTAYDPHKRLWYKDTVEKKGLVWSEVYSFATDRQPGITCTIPHYDSTGTLLGVPSVDISVLDLSYYLGAMQVTEHSRLFITDATDHLVALQMRDPDDMQGSFGGTDTPAHPSARRDAAAVHTASTTQCTCSQVFGLNWKEKREKGQGQQSQQNRSL